MVTSEAPIIKAQSKMAARCYCGPQDGWWYNAGSSFV